MPTAKSAHALAWCWVTFAEQSMVISRERRSMAHLEFSKEITALLVIDLALNNCYGAARFRFAFGWSKYGGASGTAAPSLRGDDAP